MSLEVSAPAQPPKYLGVDKLETAIFTAASTLTYIGGTHLGHMDPTSAGTLSGTVGAGAVGLKRTIQGLVPPLYKRTKRAKKVRYERSLERLRWFAQNLRSLNSLGYLDSAQDEIMFLEVVALLQECDVGAILEADIIEEVLTRNFTYYQARIKKFKRAASTQVPPPS